MLLTLYDQYGNEKAELQANDSSTQDKEVQADNVLSLGFTLYAHVAIDVNDYVDFGGERYWAVEKYEPAEKSSVEWEYSLKLYGIESLIKRFLVLNNTDGENEAVFTLTARPVDHVRLIVKCINDGMGTTDFKVGSVEGTDNVVINYEGKYCDEALKELAETVGVEWWFDGETLNLSRCEWGSAVVLGYGEGLTSLEQDKADNVKFYTRLFPIGSSRNIDRERYGASRLQLPGGAKYVDMGDLVQKYGVIHHYEQEAFSGIYPRRVGVVSSVRSKEVQDSDGKPYTIYYFKDNGLTFDPNAYEIGGLVKHVSFQEGSELAGLGTDKDHYFEVNFDSETREFEIITIWPYDDDRQLPGDTLVPKPGDKYILWNIRMPDEYYTLAETEFQTAVEEYNRKHTQDVSRYKGRTDHVWIEETGTELEIGRRVRLKSQEYFPRLGYRESRITRISRSVNLPSQMDIEISDALSSGTLEKIDDAISDAKSYAGSILGAVNVPDVIKSWETTKPTDNNIYSARRSHKEFLSRLHADCAAGRIDFLEGLRSLGDAEFGEFVEGLYAGKGGRIDGRGNAEVESLRVRTSMEVMELIVNRLSAIEGDELRSESDTITEVEDLGGGTYKLHLKDKYEGYFTAQYEHNILRGVFNTLPAKLNGLSDVTDAETTESDGRNTYFTSWMRILSDDDGGVHALPGDNWVKVVLYPDAEVPGGRNFKPCAMMNIARWGNAGYTDASTVADEGDTAEEMADKQVRAAEHLRRQQTLYLTADGRIMKLKQVNKPVVEAYMYGWVAGGSPESLYSDSSVRRRLVDGRDYVAVDGIIASQLIIAEKSQKPLVTYVDHGDWSATERYLFEQENASTLDAVGNPIVETSDVWHLGSRWRNLVADNVGHEPFWNSAFWLHVEGNAQLSMKFYTVDGVPYGDSISVRPSQVNVALVPHVFLGYEDISDRVGSWLWSRSVSPSLWTDPEYIDSETGEDTMVSRRSVRLTQSDLPSLWYESGVSFTCVATVGGATVSKSAEF